MDFRDHLFTPPLEELNEGYYEDEEDIEYLNELGETELGKNLLSKVLEKKKKNLAMFEKNPRRPMSSQFNYLDKNYHIAGQAAKRLGISNGGATSLYYDARKRLMGKDTSRIKSRTSYTDTYRRIHR